MNWATFWAIFSQTHLVALAQGNKTEIIGDNLKPPFEKIADRFDETKPTIINAHAAVK
jgi:hypothetical protein